MSEEEYKREIAKLKQEVLDLKRQIKELNIDKVTRLNTRASGGKMIYQYFRDNVLENYTHTDGLAFLFIDIDKFKEYNDTYGHAFGDKVLKQFADILFANVNPENKDILCRWGGDEFVILLNDISHSGSLEIANNIMYDINNNSDLGCKVTASIGLRHVNPDKLMKDHLAYQTDSNETVEGTVDFYINECDSMMYKAKSAGRNQLHDYSDEKVNEEENRNSKAKIK